MGNSPRTSQRRFHFYTILIFEDREKLGGKGSEMFAVPVFQKVRQKNQEMKVLMDQMRNLLWDVNAMLTLRK